MFRNNILRDKTPFRPFFYDVFYSLFTMKTPTLLEFLSGFNAQLNLLGEGGRIQPPDDRAQFPALESPSIWDRPGGFQTPFNPKLFNNGFSCPAQLG